MSNQAALQAFPLSEPATDITLMFTDVAGFTELTCRLGDREAHRVMAAHYRLVRGVAEIHEGHEVEVQGDGFLLAFAKASAAVACASDIQRALARARALDDKEGLHVRMGVHVGRVICDGARYFGREVIRCARITKLAFPDEILLTRACCQAAAVSGACATRRLELKGFAETELVYSLAWDTATQPAPRTGTRAAARGRAAELELRPA